MRFIPYLLPQGTEPGMSDDNNDLLIDLQTRLAFQDQALNELNTVVTDQQQQIDRLLLQLRLLSDQFKMLEDSVDNKQGDEPPPHY